MITKRNGNGQTECIGCKEKNKNIPLTWDSWLYTFNGKPYCQECLFEMLEDYQQRIDKAIEYIEDYKDQWCRNNEITSDMNELLSILKGEDKEC